MRRCAVVFWNFQSVRLTRLLVEVVRDRSRIRTRYRSRVRLQDRSCDIYEFVFDYEIEVVFDYEIEKKRP